MTKVILPVKCCGDRGHKYVTDSKPGMGQLSNRQIVEVMNLSGKLAELVRRHEAAGFDPLCWDLWKENAQGLLARFDAIAEVKR